MARYTCYILILFVICVIPVSHANSLDGITWYSRSNEEQPVIHLYFFWSKKCPHCLKARPDIISLTQKYEWLELHSLELTSNPDNVKIFTRMSELFHKNALSVPTFMFCGNTVSGYESWATTGRLLENNLYGCYRYASKHDPDNSTIYNLDDNALTTVNIPLLGKVSASDYSLPALTFFIAGMDAFNPCAFFVLLFLLSMMVHGRSRSKMLLIGGIFIFFSAAIYFLFMAAWLNLFIYLGELKLATIVAGALAVIIATLNIKDFFYFRKGLSLHIPDSVKPNLFDRIRTLLQLDSMTTVISATIFLAIVANSYELLCTAGFPMVYTRILTMQSLTTQSYYMYLVLYNLVYILPLLLIVVLFAIKLGARKLSEREGMVLKLLSGIMMLLLGLLLIIQPQLLNKLLTAVSLLLVSLTSTWAIVKLSR